MALSLTTDDFQEMARAVHGYKAVYYARADGSDADGGLSPTTAKLTIAAAITAASAGDLVIIGGGTWSELLTLKDGVDLLFAGSHLVYTGSAAGGLLSDGGAAVRCKVLGWPKLSQQTSHASGIGSTLRLTGNGSEVYVEAAEVLNNANSGAADASPVYLGHANATLRLKCRGAVRASVYDAIIATAGSAYIEADSVEGLDGQALETGGAGTFVVRCRKLLASETLCDISGTATYLIEVAEIHASGGTISGGTMTIRGGRWAAGTIALMTTSTGTRVVFDNFDFLSNPDAPATQISGTAATLFLTGNTLFDPAKVSGTYTDATAALRPTTPGTRLDVASTGEAGVDLSNIKQATGATTLTNIRVPNVTLADTTTTVTNAVALPATVPAGYGAVVRNVEVVDRDVYIEQS